MPIQLPTSTEQPLQDYVRAVKQLPNETARKEQFMLLIGALFPDTDAARKLPGGSERAVWIQLPDREKRGRIDSYYGNVVIEFERSLKATGLMAQHQLQEYCSGVWAEEEKPYRRLLAVATDGLNWISYRPSLPADLTGTPVPADVTLTQLRKFTVTPKTLDDFYLFLNGILFRTGQIVPTAQQFKDDFGKDSLAYRDALDAFRTAWERIKNQSDIHVAFKNWRRFLTFSYGRLKTKEGRDIERPDLEELYLKHSYLDCVAKLMVWASLSGGKSARSFSSTAEDVFSGTFFESHGLANLVERDFFHWTTNKKAKVALQPIWERIIAQIETYDLSRLTQDVLKGVYQELVDPKDRHDLGEYYTPEWLCESIVHDLLPNTGYVT